VHNISGQSRRGRALHPPFTNFPIAAYVFAAAFDIVSVAGGPHRNWATQFWHAGTFVLVGGLVVCLVTMLTGFLDLLSLPGQDPGASRTVLTHISAMSAVFVIGSADTAWRLTEYHRQASTPVAILVISLAAAIGVCVGAAYGGRLVFHYGVGVRVATGAPAPAPAHSAVPGPELPAARHRLRRGQAMRQPRR
jgi:uncharacterized membrane protein